MAAVFFTSCDNNSVDEIQGSASSAKSESVTSKTAKSAAILAADCSTVTTDNAVVYKNLTGSSGDYCAWIPTPKTIGTVSVDFEGMYGGGIRPKTTGWYIGVVDPSYTCSSGWSSIASAITVKNANATTKGTSPSCGSFIPENVVSANGVVSGLDFGIGYYGYAQPGGLTITKKVVIWKDPVATSATVATDPTDADEAYLITVTSIVPTFGTPPFYGTVSYSYTKVL
ncbi:hypothetical protein [Flavobacterium notoginsengisoli]|uniref:hypothetical protein n=1 Tax=Flavobacterium notoginsengisoli TaxID=1478199 RepID=UPI0036284125